ncbi:MAG: hypothetical protein EXX96DRAFT_570464, partial [Benjaminiella poitrasii]
MTTTISNNNKENLMDFKVLSRYDDLFTDIFLDNLFLWFNTIKMNHDHRRPRVPHHKILDIVQRNILEKGRTIDAVNEILKLDYFKHYLALKGQKQVQEFIQHMKRYLYMYMPNAGYEIGDTRRYCNNGRKVEACLIATKDWHVGDEMRLLTGMIACLDPKDDAELKKGNRDFSVMWSTRKNCSCLFLGPARFANHDCDSNCKFISLGQNSITFKVIKDIKFGQEITVYYGKHYFGENNCECKCSTCESLCMGYFASLQTTPIENKEEDQGCGTRRSTRKRKSALYEDYTHTSFIPSTRRSKRASIEPSPQTSAAVTTSSATTTHSSVDSLEELIGDQVIEQSPPIVIKKEEEEEILSSVPLPIPPVSPTTVATEKMARLKVMSIDFLCGSDEEERSPNINSSSGNSINERRVSDCPLLDMLVDVAIVASDKEKNRQQHQDLLNPLKPTTVSIYKESPPQFDSSQSSFNDSSESKADSAISLSPQLVQIKQQQQRQLQNDWEMDHNKDNGDDDMDLLDDFLDDVSDLSSVSSTELSTWTTTTTTSDEEDSRIKKKSKKRSPSPNNNNSATMQELVCIACDRPLKKEDISEQVGADISITNELATWTWSPSAIFTDWRPKRCPRCERHFTIFKQEWPTRRKPRKKKPKKDTVNTTITSKKSKKISPSTMVAKKKAVTKKSSTLSSPLEED